MHKFRERIEYKNRNSLNKFGLVSSRNMVSVVSSDRPKKQSHMFQMETITFHYTVNILIFTPTNIKFTLFIIYLSYTLDLTLILSKSQFFIYKWEMHYKNLTMGLLLSNLRKNKREVHVK